MIESLRIRHFKAFEEFSVENLGAINLITGRNNVGKTSLLEAIWAFIDRAYLSTLSQISVSRGMQSSWSQFVPTQPIIVEVHWAPHFANFDLSHPIEISVQRNWENVPLTRWQRTARSLRSSGGQVGTEGTAGENATRRFWETLEISFSPTAQSQGIPLTAQSQGIPLQDPHISEMPSQLYIPTHQSLIAQSPAIGSLVLTYRSEGVKLGQDYLKERMKVVLLGNTVQLEGNLSTDTWSVAPVPSRGYEDLVRQAQRFGAIDIENGVERLVEYLRVMEPRLKRLMLIPMRGVCQIYGEIEGPGALPIRCMGDGVERLISILLCLVMPPTVVLVDEIGSGIHHSALPRMWKLLAEVVRETGCQLFGTTHSYECIQAAIQGLEGNKKDQELFRYIRLQRPKEGSEIKPVVLNYNDAASAVESNLEIR